jgi:multiple sugar transport system ATP-binding protein/inositol-phosphate transport system ATP-binding protein
LRIIAGIETPTKGRILYDDLPLQETERMKRNIGMVFQNYALIPHWEAKRSIGFFLSLRKREEEVPERVRRVASITGVGLDKLLARVPKNLSGGEKQQVAIARAFTRDLDILLLDEPFANLDAKLRSTARLELQRLLAEFPITTILVTHDQTEAAAIGAGILLLRDGRMEQFGTYEHLRDNPDNLYVAKFIGAQALNTFDGHAQDGYWVHPLWGRLPLPKPAPNDTPLTLSIRPEFVTLQAGGVAGKIMQIHPNFSLRHQLLELEGHGMSWRADIPLDQNVRVGDTVETALNPQNALFFNASGNRFA